MNGRFSSANRHAIQLAFSAVEELKKRLKGNKGIDDCGNLLRKNKLGIMAVFAAKTAARQKDDTSRFAWIIDQSYLLDAGKEHARIVPRNIFGTK